MARPSDVSTFNTEVHRSSVADMRARGEKVSARGERVWEKTGKLDPLVDVHGKNRVSRNSMVKNDDGTFTLVNGIALPIFSAYDGTGSMAENVDRAFEALDVLYGMLGGIQDRVNTQVASGVLQDVDDHHPVFQMSQFETDTRIGDQIRLLIPDRNGGDPTEDYQFGPLFLGQRTQTDIADFYGLKGYAFIVGDQIGREDVSPAEAQQHLGLTIQGKISTKDLCRRLLPKWHPFYFQVGSGGAGGRRDRITDWWLDKLGKGRVVIVPDPYRLGPVQAGVIYVTETLQPTEEGFVEFVTMGGAYTHLSKSDAGEVWDWIVEAGVSFGAQAKLPGYNDIPLPGTIFDNYRHAWPVGHARAGENVTPVEGEAGSSPELPAGDSPKPLDWSKF